MTYCDPHISAQFLAQLTPHFNKGPYCTYLGKVNWNIFYKLTLNFKSGHIPTEACYFSIKTPLNSLSVLREMHISRIVSFRLLKPCVAHPCPPLENTNLLEKRPLMFETIKIGGFWAHLPCAEGTFCPKMALEKSIKKWPQNFLKLF